MGLRKNFDPVPISPSTITRRHHRRNCRNNPLQLPCLLLRVYRQRIRVRCQNRPDHIGCSVLSSLVRACWWCWPLWHCFTHIIITPAEPKNGLWQEDSWCRKVHQLPHQGTKNIITYRSCSCRTLWLIVSIALLAYRYKVPKKFSELLVTNQSAMHFGNAWNTIPPNAEVETKR